MIARRLVELREGCGARPPVNAAWLVGGLEFWFGAQRWTDTRLDEADHRGDLTPDRIAACLQHGNHSAAVGFGAVLAELRLPFHAREPDAHELVGDVFDALKTDNLPVVLEAVNSRLAA